MCHFQRAPRHIPGPLGVPVGVSLPCPAQGSGLWLQEHRDSPMQISSSVSASPMQRNLNSLRESANLRLAADRSGRAGAGKTGMLSMGNTPTAGCRQTHDPSREIPTEGPVQGTPGTSEAPERCPSAPTPGTGLCGVPVSAPQDTLQEMKPQNTKSHTELRPRAMGQQQMVTHSDTAPQELAPLPCSCPAEGRQ